MEGVSYAKPVVVDLTLSSKEREFKLTGQFSTLLNISCHRCLNTFEQPIEMELDLLFIPREEMPREVDVELADADMNIASYQDVIDISQIIDEQVALSLPMKRLCSQDCKGLCQRCGKNLNTGPCECSDERIDQRLLVLQDIKRKMFGDSEKSD